jgi:HAD superfamily hydrolase (TIGR01549 family)
MNLAEYIKTNNKTHVIFDFDATLFLLVLPWANWKEGLKKELIKIDASIWDEYESGSLNIAGLQNKYLKNHGQTVRDFMNNHCESFEMESLEHYEPNTDLLNTLNELDYVHKYVWSSNAQPVIKLVLDETGLADKFERIVSRQDVDFIKPMPDGFNLIHDKKVDKSKYLMVGDSSHDRGAAEAAGIDFYLTDFFDLGL